MNNNTENTMSEARNDFGRKPITRKTKKLHPRVDLTAMVSISFLLIVFFMLSSFLSRPTSMDLGMPGRGRGCGGGGCFFGTDVRMMTLLIGKDNHIVSYFGDMPYLYEEPKTLTYGENSLRKELTERSNRAVKHTGDPKRGLIVIIKPSKESDYGHLVTVLDEMAITKIPTYAVVDISPEEEKLLADK
ncbi:ExbD/TolR family protein [Flavobacterium humi]|uniref:Biopolymer transporter ExbD n=1 Tax=Flavobacterium humi TaxID=2562683 RepID=A0A4Z0LCP6_9FLAO|nr:biopolymer transporter ExbD [Flavobacterium humi]TGD59660.1 biopolymer transporter ExbD [Flavobacterium humi]